MSDPIRLAAGRVGWYQRTEHDCLRCAVASVVDLDYEDVPDFHGGRGGWERLEQWAAARGLVVCAHRHPPADREWSVGLVPRAKDAVLHLSRKPGRPSLRTTWEPDHDDPSGHAVVVRRGRFHFNPAGPWRPNQFRGWITFDREYIDGERLRDVLEKEGS